MLLQGVATCPECGYVVSIPKTTSRGGDTGLARLKSPQGTRFKEHHKVRTACKVDQRDQGT